MPNKFSSLFSIKIGGSNVPEEFYDSIEEAIVDTQLNMPGMFSIRLHDPDLKWVDDEMLDIGRELSISATLNEQDASEMGAAGNNSLIEGEITAIEPDFGEKGKTSLVIRGYDKMHRLMRGSKTRTFLNLTDTELIEKLAHESRLMIGKVEGPGVKQEYIIQYNQTNMELIAARAERTGYNFFMSGSKFYYLPGKSSTPGTPVQLVYLETLIKFKPRWTANGQADHIVVKGWDALGKEAVIGEYTPSSGLNQGGMDKPGGEVSKSAFGAADEVVTERIVSNPSDAKSVAAGVSWQIDRSFVQADGVCFGHPKVLAGCQVDIKRIGKRFSGKYFVTAAKHVYSPKGYRTHFRISGRRVDTLSAILSNESRTGQEQGLVTGIITAIVSNLKDPEKIGRVKVQYAWLGNIESNWARLATPMAGNQRGFMFLPEVNDEVVIAFEQGDIHRPYIIGTVWNTKDAPPESSDSVVKNGKVSKRIIKSRSGHLIVLDDSEGAEQIIIRDKTGANEIVIDSTEKSIRIKMDNDLITKANGVTTIESMGKLTLKSSNDVAIECVNFSVKAKASAEINAQASVNVKNAAASIALSGPSVNINNGALEVI